MSQIEIEEDYQWQLPFTEETTIEYRLEYLYGFVFFFSFFFCFYLLRNRLKGKS